jgi:hypothetical protein
MKKMLAIIAIVVALVGGATVATAAPDSQVVAGRSWA